MKASPVLTARGVTKNFGAHRVLNAVNLAVHEGEVVGLIGPNGSGKSTFLDIATGFVPIGSGSVLLGETDVTGKPPEQIARKGLGRTFQLPIMPHRMTVNEVLRASLYASPVRRTEDEQQLGQLVEQMRLGGVLESRADSISGGQRKLLSIAMAIVQRPRLLCLDEPTAGVHSSLRQLLVDILRSKATAGVAILIIEHDMRFVASLCSRCVVLDRGQVIAECAPAELASDPRIVSAYLGETASRQPASVQ